ncbi:MAG: phosphoribosylglycinamide formyltransferase [Veillonella parvula]|nr:phosphoribosylglycinamide formyltransferase [Veillonella parvula]
MTSSVAKKRLALFASGRGSNGEALYKAMQEGYINGEFVVIITDHGDAGIVERSAGYMRIVGDPLIEHYEHRILNIHPALLPSFPGLHGHQQAIDAGVKVTGCTVHFVDAGMDTGPIIMQNTVPLLPEDTEDTLSDRLLPIEHKTYKEALRLFCEDKLTIKGRVVYIEDRCVSKGRR